MNPAPPPPASVFVTTTFDFAGYEIVEYKGIVRGIVVRASSLKQDLSLFAKSFSGGNLESYMEVCENTRAEAFDLMIHHAAELGANAVVGMRYENTVMAGCAEVLCYGTAVVIIKK